MSEPINYDALDPGIRDVVRAINDWGWKTCDSGDGSKAGDMECALDHPHVFCESRWEPHRIINEAHGLAARLIGRFGPGWYVETNYSTKDGRALLYALKDQGRSNVKRDRHITARVARSVTVSIRVSENTFRKATLAARIEGRSLSSWVERLVVSAVSPEQLEAAWNENLEATLKGDIVRTRAVLSTLLSGRVIFQPTTTEIGGKSRRTYRIEASLVIGRLLVSSDDQQCRAFTSPTGFAHPALLSLPEVRVIIPAVKAA